MFHKLLTVLSGFTFIVGFFVIGMYFYWTYFPINPIVVEGSEKIYIYNKGNVVKRGELLLYQIKICKNVDTPSVISRQFVDGILFRVPDVVSHMKKGCDTIISSIVVPDKLPTGKYQLYGTVINEVNPIRTISLTWKTEEFLVE